jgi:hypothetical protein
MKRLILIALLALIQPLPAFARIQQVFNNNGTLTASPLGFSLGSNLTSIFTSGGSDIGSVTITTGPLISGSLVTGGQFSSVLSSYTVTLNPGVSPYLPGGGIVFNGSFTGPIGWFPLRDEPGYYELQGMVAGSWSTCNCSGVGWTSQIYVGSFNSQGVFTATVGSGFAYINPEPGTLVLFTTGLCCIGFMVRRKRLRV